MTNPPSPGPDTGVPEPHEPWRVARRGRRPRRNRRWARRWALPVAGGLLAVAGAAGALQLATAPGPSRPAPGAVAATHQRPGPPEGGTTPAPREHRSPRADPSPRDRDRRHAEAEGPTRRGPAAADDRGHRPRPPRGGQPQGAEPAPRPRAQQPRVEDPRAHKPRTRGPRARKPERTPDWIRTECRRRYPADATRRNACVAALRGASGR